MVKPTSMLLSELNTQVAELNDAIAEVTRMRGTEVRRTGKPKKDLKFAKMELQNANALVKEVRRQVSSFNDAYTAVLTRRDGADGLYADLADYPSNSARGAEIRREIGQVNQALASETVRNALDTIRFYNPEDGTSREDFISLQEEADSLLEAAVSQKIDAQLGVINNISSDKKWVKKLRWWYNSKSDKDQDAEIFLKNAIRQRCDNKRTNDNIAESTDADNCGVNVIQEIKTFKKIANNADTEEHADHAFVEAFRAASQSADVDFKNDVRNLAIEDFQALYDFCDNNYKKLTVSHNKTRMMCDGYAYDNFIPLNEQDTLESVEDANISSKYGLINPNTWLEDYSDILNSMNSFPNDDVAVENDDVAVDKANLIGSNYSYEDRMQAVIQLTADKEALQEECVAQDTTASSNITRGLRVNDNNELECYRNAYYNRRGWLQTERTWTIGADEQADINYSEVLEQTPDVEVTLQERVETVADLVSQGF